MCGRESDDLNLDDEFALDDDDVDGAGDWLSGPPSGRASHKYSDRDKARFL
jgi:hypothetical protein